MSSPPKPPDLPEDVKKLTDQILQDISGLLDRQQRTIVMSEKLAALSPEVILEIFQLLAHGAAAHDSKYQDGFQAISDVKKMGKLLGFGKMSEVYTLARRKSYEDVVRFLQMLPPARQLGPDDELEEDPFLRDMTLGRKRALAKIREPDLINRLCHDQDPVVIQNLLKNPRVTIKEVVKIASKRPTSAQILWTVFRDLKWSNHYTVKMTLINNPYTPTQISMALLHYIMEYDLLDVAENMVLHPALRKAAADIIKMKRNLGKEKKTPPPEEEEESSQ